MINPDQMIVSCLKLFGFLFGFPYLGIIVSYFRGKASGMSTSSAMFCAVWLALNARNKFSERQVYKDNITCDEDLMEYLGCNENGQNFKDLIGDKGVGTFGGSEDHTAIMSCTKGQLNLFSYCPTHREGVFECPGDLIFVIAVSGAIAEKTGDKMQDYNDASLLAQEAARVYWDTAGEKLTPPHLCNVVKHAKGDPDSVRSSIHEYFKNGGASSFTELQLTRRFDQFFAESEEIVAQVYILLPFIVFKWPPCVESTSKKCIDLFVRLA